jgi:mono/diheme cytochrome c family protein
VRKIILGVLAVVAVVGIGAVGLRAVADDAAKAAEPSTNGTPSTTPAPAGEAPVAGAAAAPAGGPMLGPATPPLELVASTPKGQLKNPYNGDISAISEEGHHRFLSAGCNGCHGGGGGGGMCPSLTNDVWVYGAGDDTLFRLVTLGSVELKKQGYSPVRTETVPGPMPPFGGIIKTSDDLWRIIAFIRSVNPGSMKHVDDPYVPLQ